MTGRTRAHTITLKATVALAALLLLPASAAAQPLDRIELPDGIRPEGITTMDGMLYVGSLSNGRILSIDPLTGERTVFVKGDEGKTAVGVEAEPANGRIWTVGGPRGDVRAYDAESGDLLETFVFQAGFLNDLVATPEAIYVTDSFVPEIVVIPLRKNGGLKNPGRATALTIEGDLVYEDGKFNANGIVATPAGLIVVQSEPGALFRIDPETGIATTIDTGDIDLTWGDGLELDGQTLYVVRNRFNTVAVLELDETFETATLVAELTSEDLAVPSTAALLDDDLWLVNARFGTTAEGDTKYWLTRLAVPSADEG